MSEKSETTLYLVWNPEKSECVGFLDKGDADYTATGDSRHLKDAWRPAIGDEFRASYGDEADRLPQTEVAVSALVSEPSQS